MSHPRSVAEQYGVLSLNARLAAALLATTRVLQQTGVSSPDIDALLEHMWTWPTVDEHVFAEWEAFSNPVLEWALGGVVPESLATAVETSELGPQGHRELLESTVELVYGNLYTTVHHAETLEHLGRVEALAALAGVSFPEPGRFEGSPGADLSGVNGWGHRMSPDEVARWRAVST